MAVETIPWHVEGMKQHSWLQRIGTYLLGLVDEYWACLLYTSDAADE